MNSPPISCQSSRVLSCMRVKFALALMGFVSNGVRPTVDLRVTVNCQEFDNQAPW
jgi:hypothetical protein